MQIAVLVKIVADDQDLAFGADGRLDYSRSQNIISAYDLNAIEASVSLAEKVGDSHVKALTIGAANIDDSKLKKNILARGVDELHLLADDACSGLDARATAGLLAGLVNKSDDIDLIVAGDGSADLFAQQVDVQLASLLNLPYVSGVISIEKDGDSLLLERQLDSEIETLKVSCPAVIAVSPDIAIPRICGMKDILAAGKKPSNIEQLDGEAQSSTEVVFERQPAQADRELQLYNVSTEGDLEKFVTAVKGLL